jgi:hypothetical protein
MKTFASHVIAQQRVPLAKEDFNNQVGIIFVLKVSVRFFPQLPRLPQNGLVNKMFVDLFVGLPTPAGLWPLLSAQSAISKDQY